MGMMRSQGQEKAFLVGISTNKLRPRVAREHLEELHRLATTSGCEVAGTWLQRLPAFNPATMVGEGKLLEIKEACQEHDVKLVIFDEELTGSQIRNIEAILEGVKVLDRPGIILDIFARNARTAEASLMVEVAQLEYSMPRLTRAWTHLCRQVGGIGTRGPGETQLETDRRTIRKRISDLKVKLEHIEKSRKHQARRRNSVFQVAVVGYTNAGKSTITNRLTGAGVLVEDKLFATLDSTTRKLFLEPGRSIILSDTVGFIRKLPHHLFSTFRSTLGVASEADLIVEVVDCNAPNYAEHMEVTHHVLNQLVEDVVPRLRVFNKADAASQEILDILRHQYPDALFLSATEGIGLELLKKGILSTYVEWENKHLAS